MSTTEEEQEEQIKVLMMTAGICLVIGIFLGAYLASSQPDNSKHIEFRNDYTFTHPGDKLTIQDNETHRVLSGCLSERLDSSYYRLKLDTKERIVTIMKIQDGGQEAFFGSEFDECVVSKEEGWHPSYDVQNMTLRNGDTLQYRLNKVEGDWKVSDWWIAE